MIDTIKNYLSKTYIIILLLIIWELASRYFVTNQALFPPPTTVIQVFFDTLLSGEILIDAGFSFMRIMIGFLMGSTIGIIVGLLTGRYRLFDKSVTTLIQLLRPIPPIALVPFAIIWLGLGEPSKWAVIVWGVFFPVWLNTHSGVSNVEPQFIWAAKSLGANKMSLLKEIVIPYAARYIITGLRVSIGIAYICVVVAEMSGASAGLGFRINVSHLVFRVDKMIVALIVLGLMGSLTDKIFLYTVNKLLPWYKVSKV